MTLPLVISPGDVGHIEDHEELHELLQQLDGQNDFLATGVYQDLLASLPVASASNRGLFRYATDVPALAYSDGSAWRVLIATGTTNQFTAINEFEDDVYFGSGRPWHDPMHSTYNATGDGVADDQAAVQAAATAAEDSILLLDESFAVSRIVLPDNVLVMGRGSLLKKDGASGTNNGVLHIEDVESVTVVGITIDAANFVTPYDGGTVTQRACITIANDAIHVVIRDVTMTNGGRDGIYCYRTTGGSPTDIVIEHCTITESTRWGIAVIAGVDIRIVDCNIDGGGLGGIDFEPNTGGAIDNCIVERCRIYEGHTTSAQLVATLGAGAAGPYHRVHFWNNYVEGIDDLPSAVIRFASFAESSVIGNTVTGASEQAISVTGNSDRVVVANNRIADSRTQTVAPSTTTASIFVSGDYCVITGNIIENSYWNGILLSSADYTVVTCNVVRDVGQAFTALAFAGDGIHVFNSNHNFISDNLVVDTQGTPTMANGIRTRQSGAPTCIGNYLGPNRAIGARLANWSITSGTTAGSGRTATVPGAIAAGATVTVAVTVTGARSSRACFASVESLSAGLVASLPFVSANDTVTLHITNVSAAPINPGTITTYVQMLHA